MEKTQLTHDTPTEYRALADTKTYRDLSRGWEFRFDIYGGPGRGARNDIPADCHISIETWKNGGKRTTFASGVLDLTDMMELYAMLGEAIERAQKAQKVAA